MGHLENQLDVRVILRGGRFKDYHISPEGVLGLLNRGFTVVSAKTGKQITKSLWGRVVNALREGHDETEPTLEPIEVGIPIEPPIIIEPPDVPQPPDMDEGLVNTVTMKFGNLLYTSTDDARTQVLFVTVQRIVNNPTAPVGTVRMTVQVKDEANQVIKIEEKISNSLGGDIKFQMFLKTTDVRIFIEVFLSKESVFIPIAKSISTGLQWQVSGDGSSPIGGGSPIPPLIAAGIGLMFLKDEFKPITKRHK